MKHIIFTVLAFATALCIKAQEKPYELNVGEFKEFTVADNINVIYKCMPDSAGLATFTCLPETAHAITFSSKKQKLKIEVISDNSLPGVLPTVTIYSSTLEKATNWGDSTITVLDLAPVPSFKAKVIGNGMIVAPDVRATKVDAAVEAGNGRIFVSGQAASAKFTIASVGAIEGGCLEAQSVKCVVFGTGSIDCHPQNELTVTGAGTGKVYYLGKPKIKKYSVGVGVISVDVNAQPE